MHKIFEVGEIGDLHQLLTLLGCQEKCNGNFARFYVAGCETGFAPFIRCVKLSRRVFDE
jgi:hypothetical protein